MSDVQLRPARLGSVPHVVEGITYENVVLARRTP